MSISNSLPTSYQQFIHKSRYARWLDDEGRRENWHETVERYVSFMEKALLEKHDYKLSEGDKLIMTEYITNLSVMPSMRAFMTAGEALERDNVCGYNCSYLPVDSPRSFDEAMYILMCGTGVGFSVERENVDKLPVVSESMQKSDVVIVVDDSKVGWAKAYRELIALLYSGMIPSWDVSKIRPAGARLKVMGGRASGPDPLVDLFKFTVRKFEEAKGRRLFPIECHDIMCHLADAVTAGGNRRAALISLFSADDDFMLNCKAGHEWMQSDSQRFRANNSAVLLRHRVDKKFFDGIWNRIKTSGSGEPGIYLTNDKDWGTNPCCEIGLRPYQFCNLTEINSSTVENQEDFDKRVEAAVILGTLQASYTDFHYLRDIWRETTEKDALLGVSLTGLASNRVYNLDLTGTVYNAKQINATWANILGINPAARLSCVKPSGTASMVCGSSSGIHAWFDEYYIRRIRVGRDEAICQYLSAFHPELIVDDENNPDGRIIEIPQKAPTGGLTKKDETTFMFLERVKNTTLRWVKPGHTNGQNTHNVSATVFIEKDEWDEVGEWMWLNRHFYNGLSCFPNDESVYTQAPFESCSKETYDEMMKALTLVDLTQIVEYDDDSNFGQDPACAGGACEI